MRTGDQLARLAFGRLCNGTGIDNIYIRFLGKRNDHIAFGSKLL